MSWPSPYPLLVLTVKKKKIRKIYIVKLKYFYKKTFILKISLGFCYVAYPNILWCNEIHPKKKKCVTRDKIEKLCSNEWIQIFYLFFFTYS